MNNGFATSVAEGLDAGIRLGERQDEHMVAVPITPPRPLAIVGSPGYVEHRGVPETPADRMRHYCLADRVTFSRTIDRRTFTSPATEARTVVLVP